MFHTAVLLHTGKYYRCTCYISATYNAYNFKLCFCSQNPKIFKYAILLWLLAAVLDRHSQKDMLTVQQDPSYVRQS